MLPPRTLFILTVSASYVPGVIFLVTCRSERHISSCRSAVANFCRRSLRNVFDVCVCVCECSDSYLAGPGFKSRLGDGLTSYFISFSDSGVLRQRMPQTFPYPSFPIHYSVVTSMVDAGLC